MILLSWTIQHCANHWTFPQIQVCIMFLKELMKQTCIQLIVILDYSTYCGSTEETVLHKESPKLKVIAFSSYLENHLIPMLCNFVFLE